MNYTHSRFSDLPVGYASHHVETVCQDKPDAANPGGEQPGRQEKHARKEQHFVAVSET